MKPNSHHNVKSPYKLYILTYIIDHTKYVIHHKFTQIKANNIEYLKYIFLKKILILYEFEITLLQHIKRIAFGK
jgi:hypothetical protein